jgi:hypothetical protein
MDEHIATVSNTVLICRLFDGVEITINRRITVAMH